MNHSLARKYTFFSLIKFSFPTIIMMIFSSMYTMADGIIVARYIGTDALSAVNITYPLSSVAIAIGVMLATGGSSIIARNMGEKKPEKARKNFSLIVLIAIIAGITITILGLLFFDPMLKLLGANERIYSLCYDYAFTLLFFLPSSILLMLFQTLFVTAGKPSIGLIITFLGGITNIVLDYIFIVPMNMGIGGASLATGIGYSIPALFGLFYFAFQRKGHLFFVKFKLNRMVILHTCANGSSEMVTNLSTAVTTYLFNIAMMKHLGENGVAAITIILYVQYLLTAVYLGYSIGISPVLSFKYGSGEKEQINKIFRISMIFIFICSVITTAISLLFASPIVMIFTPKDNPVYELAIYGLRLFSISFLFTGFNIFSSSMFTAFSDGLTSAILSFLRTFVFIILCLSLLPLRFGVNGIWLAIPIAEVFGFIVSVVFLFRKRNLYT